MIIYDEDTFEPIGIIRSFLDNSIEGSEREKRKYLVITHDTVRPEIFDLPGAAEIFVRTGMDTRKFDYVDVNYTRPIY